MWGCRQTRDVAVMAIGAPTSLLKGNSATVEVAIGNRGTETQTFDVVLSGLIDNASIGTRHLTIVSGGFIIIAFSWDTADKTLGEHLLTASPNLADDDLTNNSLSNTVTLDEAAQPLALGFLITRDAYKTWNGGVTPRGPMTRGRCQYLGSLVLGRSSVTCGTRRLEK